MQPGQRLSLSDDKEVNNWVNNPCARCHVQEFSPESVPRFLLFQDAEKSLQRRAAGIVTP